MKSKLAGLAGEELALICRLQTGIAGLLMGSLCHDRCAYSCPACERAAGALMNDILLDPT